MRSLCRWLRLLVSYPRHPYAAVDDPSEADAPMQFEIGEYQECDLSGFAATEDPMVVGNAAMAAEVVRLPEAEGGDAAAEAAGGARSVAVCARDEI